METTSTLIIVGVVLYGLIWLLAKLYQFEADLTAILADMHKRNGFTMHAIKEMEQANGLWRTAHRLEMLLFPWRLFR